MRRGQAMLETVIAVLILTSVFLCLFKLSRVLTGKILVQHAAMRVARARAVGFNEFMCLKSARVSVIPVAGERLWPTGDDALTTSEELARIGIYMQTVDDPHARGILEYEGWQCGCLGVDAGDGTRATVSMRTGWLEDADDRYFGFDLTGEAGIEQNYPLYMNNSGL